MEFPENQYSGGPDSLKQKHSANVCMVQLRLPSYRIPFFVALRENLYLHRINLRLICSEPLEAIQSREDTSYLDWATYVQARQIFSGTKALLWQPISNLTSGCDLLILQQENRLLANYYVLLRKFATGQKVAFWGHGRNFNCQGARRFPEVWRLLISRTADWWFGYTELTRSLLLKAGYPEDRITTINNTIDVKELQYYFKMTRQQELNELRRKLGISGNNVAAYCGSIYPGKRIDFLISAALRIKTHIRDFELLIIGSGPDAYVAAEAAERFSFIHYVGRLDGYDKVRHLMLAKVLLLPYIVGLAIIDGFAAGLPVITMNNGSHSPEIAYLRHGENGLITGNSLEEYVATIVRMLRDEARLCYLSKRCIEDSDHYSIQHMVASFVSGILQCLSYDSPTHKCLNKTRHNRCY